MTGTGRYLGNAIGERRGQERAPLYEAVAAYLDAGVLPFHMPGHKQGQGAPAALTGLMGAAALRVDLTEVPGLDDLHAPRGAVREAQELAAAAFGADHTLFLVNGATAGIHAAFLALCGEGEEVVVPRHAHRAVIGGLVLSGAVPVYVVPEFDQELGLVTGVRPEAVEEVLVRHPGARAVFMVHPTYHGFVSDLAAVARLAHSHGMPLIVDEAHGTHFRFHPSLPPSALSLGADVAVQGAHKTGGALTQAAFLHGREGRIDWERLVLAARHVQTTSPSYLLMVSLDLARRELACRGRELIDACLGLAERVRRQINGLRGFWCPGQEVCNRPGIAGLDPTKLVIKPVYGRNARDVDAVLRRRFGIQVEFSDPGSLLAMITAGDTAESVDRLVNALRWLDGQEARERPPAGGGGQACNGKGRHGLRGATAQPEWGGGEILWRYAREVPPQVMSPREAAMSSRHRLLPLSRAVGRVSAEVVTVYPPGIPFLCPGEEITPGVAETWHTAVAAGLHVQGGIPGTPPGVRVVG